VADFDFYEYDTLVQSCNTLLVDNSDVVFASAYSSDGRIFCMNPGQVDFVRFIGKSNTGDYNADMCLKESNNDKFIITWANGVIKIDGTTNATAYISGSTLPNCHGITITNDGMLYALTTARGIWSKSSTDTSAFVKQANSPVVNPPYAMVGIHVDPADDNIIWCTSYNGSAPYTGGKIFSFNRTTKVFTECAFSPAGAMSYSRIRKDPNGDLYMSDTRVNSTVYRKRYGVAAWDILTTNIPSAGIYPGAWTSNGKTFALAGTTVYTLYDADPSPSSINPPVASASPERLKNIISWTHS